MLFSGSLLKIFNSHINLKYFCARVVIPTDICTLGQSKGLANLFERSMHISDRIFNKFCQQRSWTLLESKTLSFKTADCKTKYPSTKQGVWKGISFPH